MAHRVGQQFGNYRLARLLGLGGFAEVYLGEHIYLKTQAAIKIVHTLLDSDDLYDFLAEAQTIARLRHPHIIQVLDFGVEGGIPYLVMDYAPNGTLRARHRRGVPLPPGAFLPYVKQVADALQYAHDQRLIHRDIKPENMLLGRNQEVLLSDFGIATVAQTTAHQRTQGFAGTAAYAAPEQLRGKPVFASDQYALAIIIYEWLAGETPFRGAQLEIAFQQVSVAPPSLRLIVPDLSPTIEQVVFTALAKAPQDRFASVRAFATALEQAIQAAPGRMTGPSSWTVAPLVPGVASGAVSYTTTAEVVPPTLPTIPPAADARQKAPALAMPPAPASAQFHAADTVYPTRKADGQPPAPPAASALPPTEVEVAHPLVLPAPSPPKRLGRTLLLALLVVVVLTAGSVALWVTKGGQARSLAGQPTTGPALAARQVLQLPAISGQDIQTMDPAEVVDANSYQAASLVYTGLVNVSAQTMQVIPSLATNWNISADGKTYTFHLRPNLKFSNGDPLTASDVAYSIDRAFDPAINGASGLATYYLPDIVGGADRAAGRIATMIGAGNGLVVVDALTLQIHLEKPIAYFLAQLTYPISWVVDKKVIDQYGANWSDGHAVGSGPFVLQSWQHNIKLTFVPNPHWSGARTHLTEIDMPIIPDADMALRAFKAGQLDIDNAVNETTYAQAKALGPKEFAEGPALWINYLAPNSNVPPFDNLTVRQAFAEAVDRETIANTLLDGFYAPSDHLVPQGQPGYDAGLRGLPFNPKDAKTKLLSIYPDLSKMPTVTLEYPRGGVADAIETKMQQDFQTYLGVQINLNPVTYAQLVSDVETKNAQGLYPVQLYSLGWVAEYPDPEDWTSLQVAAGAPYNNMNFENPQVDQLLAQADVAQSPTTRFALYNQAEELAVDQVAWIPYAQAKNFTLFQKDVHGYALDAAGYTPPDVWANVYLCAGPC